jgi:hypothetical protein
VSRYCYHGEFQAEIFKMHHVSVVERLDCERQRLARRPPDWRRMPCGQFPDPTHVIMVVMGHENGADLESQPLQFRFDRPGVPRITTATAAGSERISQM